MVSINIDGYMDGQTEEGEGGTVIKNIARFRYKSKFSCPHPGSVKFILTHGTAIKKQRNSNNYKASNYSGQVYIFRSL